MVDQVPAANNLLVDDEPAANILLVDDEPKNLIALAAVLEGSDRNLVCAGSGQEALKHLLRDDFAAVLLDVHMPGLDGFETAELIRGRERSRDTPIIFLTAAIRGETFISKGYSLGAVDYILKPFDPDILRSKVAVFVELFRKTERIKRAEHDRAQLIVEQAARAEAEATRDRLQQLVDVLPTGIAIADASGRIYMSNAAAQAIMGQLPLVPNAAAFGDLGILRVDGSRCPVEDLPVTRVVQRGEVVRDEQLLIPNAKTGEQVPVLVNGAPLRGAGGEPTGGVIVFQDISALKEVERQKDEFLSAASHDLKNPLTAIKARAQILQRRAARIETPEGADLAAGLAGIDQTATRLTGMINELLDVARLQMGRPLDLDRRPTDLTELAREVASNLQSATERHKIEVESDGELVGEWDRSRLERVVTNLVSNAVKYSPEGGLVTLAVSRERDDTIDWAILRVRDQGIGIPPDDLPQVFERFYRGSNVTRAIEGTGIGLSGARQIVEQHGGQVSVESLEWQGSTFTMRLPLDDGPPCGTNGRGLDA